MRDSKRLILEQGGLKGDSARQAIVDNLLPFSVGVMLPLQGIWRGADIKSGGSGSVFHYDLQNPITTKDTKDHEGFKLKNFFVYLRVLGGYWFAI